MNQILSLLFLGVLSVFFVRCNSPSPTGETSQKPNIIYILADDLGYGDLGFTGQEKFETPNIDKLAKEGMFFTQHYAGSTVCAPSRSSLMTGLHTGHTFIRGNREVRPEGQYPLHSEVLTLAELLKEDGYKTGAFGKWGLGFPGSEGDPNFQGFDTFYGYNCQRLGHNYYPYYLWDNQEKDSLDGNRGTLKQDYAPFLINQRALAFLEENKDNPFFLYYPTIIPHAELDAPENVMEQFRGKYPEGEPYVGHDEDSARYKLGGYGSQTEPHAAFAGMISILDQHVGNIMKKLAELGIADNTIIIFTSDNGPHLEGGANPDFFDSNGPYKGYKRDLYEGGIRVPMIASWPGKIKTGTTSDHVSAFWDVLPTVCDLAEIKKPENLDGISFLPEMLGQEQEQHEYLYWEFYQNRGKGKQAVRMGDWKGVRLAIDQDAANPIELYNLASDRSEENNVAAEHPEIVERISLIMDQEHVPSAIFQFGYEMNSSE